MHTCDFSRQTIYTVPHNIFIRQTFFNEKKESVNVNETKCIYLLFKTYDYNGYILY